MIELRYSKNYIILKPTLIFRSDLKSCWTSQSPASKAFLFLEFRFACLLLRKVERQQSFVSFFFVFFILFFIIPFVLWPVLDAFDSCSIRFVGIEGRAQARKDESRGSFDPLARITTSTPPSRQVEGVRAIQKPRFGWVLASDSLSTLYRCVFLLLVFSVSLLFIPEHILVGNSYLIYEKQNWKRWAKEREISSGKRRNIKV